MCWNKGTILVVDDEPESLALVRSILEEDGHQVRTADGGELALASSVAAPPELILLDVRMPDMDGLELCRRLKAHRRTCDVPVMFVSGSSEMAERVEGLLLGAVDFVTKPFSRPELIARVRTHLELGRLRSRLEAQVAERTEALALTVRRLEREIKERANAENALSESEMRFRNMADSAPVMIVTSDPNMAATFFNREWLNFTGRTMTEEFGRGWLASVHPADLTASLAGFAESYEARKECQLEYRLRRADGEYGWVLFRAAPRFDASGTLAGYVACATDITESKRAHQAALARQKLESLGVLAGGIAHDFNNLLSTILANSELLQADLDENSPLQATATEIGTVAYRAAGIVRQLMAFAGQDSASVEMVDLAALIREMLKLMNISISKRAVLEVQLPDNLPPIRANSAQLRQVVMNLIINASEALEGKNGVISVSLARSRSDPAGGADVSDGLVLEVADTGKGMTAETQAKIFDPYFTTRSAGRGLGLAAVQGIIRGHGGTIETESVPQKGTKFKIVFPFSLDQVPDARDIPFIAPPGSGRLNGTILIIEDEDSLRSAVARFLQKKGLSVIETSNGVRGVDLFRANACHIDLVLLDLTLPELSGHEVLTELRRIRPDVKVIIHSAYSQDWAQSATSVDERCWYIRKPYSLTELESLLRNTGLQESQTDRNA